MYSLIKPAKILLIKYVINILKIYILFQEKKTLQFVKKRKKFSKFLVVLQPLSKKKQQNVITVSAGRPLKEPPKRLGDWFKPYFWILLRTTISHLLISTCSIVFPCLLRFVRVKVPKFCVLFPLFTSFCF